MSINFKNIHFIQGVDFEFIQLLPNNGIKAQARKVLSKLHLLEGTKNLLQCSSK